MKTFNIGIAVLLLGCAASAQAGEPADPNLAATIRQQAMQAQASIRASALTDLHADARR